MDKFYFMGSNILPQTAFAVADDNTKMPHDLLPELENKTSIPFTFTMKSYLDGDNEIEVSDDLSEIEHLWTDYLPNDFAWPIMSTRMKEIIDGHLTGMEGIIWMAVTVKADKENREYYIPRFKQVLDVLDIKRTKFVKNTDLVIEAVFDKNKINKYAMFQLPDEILWSITSSLYVSEQVKSAIENSALTGVSFDLKTVV